MHCPLLVIEVQKSNKMGVPEVGMPTAMGLGVSSGVFPPKGATVATDGSELINVIIHPWDVANGR
tara:strand:+ start:1892 stop:2086 length:195 start_codon:yes stop_codon:yes gene_type:complete